MGKINKFLYIIVFLFILAAGVTAGSIVFYAFDNKKPSPFPVLIEELSLEKRKAFLEDLMTREGIDSVWRFFKSHQIPAVGYDSYTSGELLYKHYGLKGVEMCDPAFIKGCSSGVIKALMVKFGLDAIKQLPNRCFNKEGHITYCAHGIGHGLADVTDFDVPKALAYCDSIVDEYRLRPECWGGVVQESAIFAAVKVFNKKDGNLWRPCDELSVKYRGVCAFVLADLVWFGRDKLDISKIIEKCVSVDDEMLRKGCLLGSGYRIAKLSIGSSSYIQNQCNLFPKNIWHYCIMSAAGALPVLNYKNWPDNAKKLCELLPKEYSEECQQSASYKSLWYLPAGRL